MTITLHTDKCVGCGMCSSVAPELFSTDTGVVALKKEPASYSDDDKKLAQEAASACPNGVIEIADT